MRTCFRRKANSSQLMWRLGRNRYVHDLQLFFNRANNRRHRAGHVYAGWRRRIHNGSNNSHEMFTEHVEVMRQDTHIDTAHIFIYLQHRFLIIKHFRDDHLFFHGLLWQNFQIRVFDVLDRVIFNLIGALFDFSHQLVSIIALLSSIMLFWNVCLYPNFSSGWIAFNSIKLHVTLKNLMNQSISHFFTFSMTGTHRIYN